MTSGVQAWKRWKGEEQASRGDRSLYIQKTPHGKQIMTETRDSHHRRSAPDDDKAGPHNTRGVLGFVLGSVSGPTRRAWVARPRNQVTASLYSCPSRMHPPECPLFRCANPSVGELSTSEHGLQFRNGGRMGVNAGLFGYLAEVLQKITSVCG